jgi:elongation factor P hydroxylase
MPCRWPNAGRMQHALAIFPGVFEADGRWRALIPRLAAVGLLEVGPQALQNIVSVTAGGQ